MIAGRERPSPAGWRRFGWAGGACAAFCKKRRVPVWLSGTRRLPRGDARCCCILFIALIYYCK